MGGGPHGAVVGVRGAFVMPWWWAGAWSLDLVAGWAAVAGRALAGDPASAATLAPGAAMAAVLAVVAAIAGVALGLRVAMGLGVGGGRVLCLGVHGRPLVGAKAASSSSSSSSTPSFAGALAPPQLYSWAQL